MDTETLIKEFINNHSEAEVLDYCTSVLVSRHNVMMRELCAKNYEKAAGAMGETTLPLAILAALNAKKSGKKKEVAVA